MGTADNTPPVGGAVTVSVATLLWVKVWPLHDSVARNCALVSEMAGVSVYATELAPAMSANVSAAARCHWITSVPLLPAWLALPLLLGLILAAWRREAT